MEAAAANDSTAEPTTPSATILCVDDEKPILSSLRRLFRRAGYNVLLANSGREALEVLAKESVDLLISDMRMPEMTGAELLAQVAQQWPDTVRILLTGYADIESSIAAINEGKIYRYVSKPWDDNDMSLLVQSALEQKFLKAERQRLEELTQQQNLKLKELNGTLEAKVKARTADVQKTLAMLKQSHSKLTQSYHDTIAVFSSIIDLRDGVKAGHGRRIADLAKGMAATMELDDKQQQHIFFAGLLHNIGKLGLSDELFRTPYSTLTPEQLKEFHKYPEIGQTVLVMLEPLEATSLIVGAHKERSDGKGYPQGLHSTDIPLGAQILALAVDFYEYQMGMLTGEPTERDEAYTFIQSNVGGRYQQNIVEAFNTVYAAEHGEGRLVTELRISPDDMQQGMVMATDVTFRGGILLLRKGQELNQELIERIHNVSEQLDQPTISIVSKQDTGDTEATG